MLTLAIDASTLATGVALVSEEKVLAEFCSQIAKTHSQRLLPAIDYLMMETGVVPRQLSSVTVSSGPGSFTGLRIGMSTAKGLAHALGIPIVGINTLDMLAHNLPHFTGLIVPILDARRGEVYSAIYRWEGSSPVLEIAHQAVAVETLVQQLLTFSGPIAFVGDAVNHYWERLHDQLGDRMVLTNTVDRSPRPGRLGQLGLERFQRGDIDDLYSLVPEYIRQSEAERQLLQRVDTGGC